MLDLRIDSLCLQSMVAPFSFLSRPTFGKNNISEYSAPAVSHVTVGIVVGKRFFTVLAHPPHTQWSYPSRGSICSSHLWYGYYLQTDQFSRVLIRIYDQVRYSEFRRTSCLSPLRNRGVISTLRPKAPQYRRKVISTTSTLPSSARGALAVNATQLGMVE